jgi:hypothetical protein
MKKLLLPYRWKFAGILLILMGSFCAVLYTWFEFQFKMPVFAVYSAFFETKMFVTFQTNFADELILLLLVTGFGLVVFSKEKNETEILGNKRSDAMFKAMLANNILLLLSILFVFGSGFIAVLVFNLISVSVLYLLFFYLTDRTKEKKNSV